MRIITATNVNLEEAVAQGKFRADLYYRINVVTIFLPPLRERSDDIPLLAGHFVQKFNRENGLNVALHDDALDILKKCPWPGNVRELENCIERAATLCRDGVIWDLDLSCQMNLCYSSTLWHHRTVTPTAGASVPAPAGRPPGQGMPLPQAAPARAGCSTGGVPGCSAALRRKLRRRPCGRFARRFRSRRNRSRRARFRRRLPLRKAVLCSSRHQERLARYLRHEEHNLIFSRGYGLWPNRMSLRL